MLLDQDDLAALDLLQSPGDGQSDGPSSYDGVREICISRRRRRKVTDAGGVASGSSRARQHFPGYICAVDVLRLQHQNDGHPVEFGDGRSMPFDN